MSDPVPTSQRLDGRVAVITGGASGIGLSTARRFIAEGARVVISDRDGAALARVAEDLDPGLLATLEGDASDESDVAALVEVAIDRFGRLDIAFANAGIGGPQRIVDCDLNEWSRVLDVNLTGPFLLIKHAAPHMTAGGSIVVTASLNAVQAGTGMAAYCSSKAGVAMLVEVAALELGPQGIRVNAIGPGFVRTSLTEGAFAVPAIVEGYAENTPLGRHAHPDEIAGLVAYLASDESSFVSGTLQLIDGGAHIMRYPDILGILGA
ncbi:MAG: SDR family oxidoreductase [Acidimicrobiales bacterium]|nr:SDR family oxidoreductase [Acidimicrobiales bacterium]